MSVSKNLWFLRNLPPFYFYCAHARTNITLANIKLPGYLEYTINFKYYFHRASGVYGENTRMKRELREHIYLYIYVTRKPGICSILGSHCSFPRFQVWRTILGLCMLELINSVHVELEEEKILKEEKTDAAHPWVCPS